MRIRYLLELKVKKAFFFFAILLSLTAELPSQAIKDNLSQAFLRIQPEYRGGTYNRKNWRHWLDVDKDCQNTRQEVLIKYSRKGLLYRGKRNCRVTKGSWLCPYTGESFTNPKKIDIDHIVALKEAYESGAHLWNKSRKKEFANDLVNLLPSQAKANRSKGHRDLSEWMPKKNRCSYLKKWLFVKIKYKLSLDRAEKRAIESLVGQCQKLKLPKFIDAS